MLNRRRFAMLASLAILAGCGDAANTTAPSSLSPSSRANATILVNPTTVTATSGLSSVFVSTDGVNYSPAFVIASNSAWGTAVGGGSYVASFANADQNGPDGINKSTYKTTVTIPDNAVGASLTVRAYADNWAAVSVNGQQFGSMAYFETYGQWAWNFGGSGWAGWTYPKSPSADAYTFATTKGLVAGANTISFALENWGGPEGLSFQATVTYDAKYINACASVRSLVTQNGVANSLCAKLSAAAAAENAGDLNGKAGVLGAFQNEVKAQTSKFIPTANVPKLLAIAAAL